MPYPRVPLEDRFWSRVKKGPGCWEWTAGRSRGYGQIVVARRGGKLEQVYAHRFSYELVNGAITDGLFVLHSCDNRLCVNPSHLHLGTTQDNTRERDERGRAARGETHWSRTRPEDFLRLQPKRSSITGRFLAGVALALLAAFLALPAMAGDNFYKRTGTKPPAGEFVMGPSFHYAEQLSPGVSLGYVWEATGIALVGDFAAMRLDSQHVEATLTVGCRDFLVPYDTGTHTRGQVSIGLLIPLRSYAKAAK